MTTEAQVYAYRSNAQKSTGPRTPAGKAIVAQNAIPHGLLAQEVVIKGEDPGDFALYRDGMLEDLAPAGPMESMLAERIVALAWRLRRAERLQGAAFDTLAEEKKKWVWSEEDRQYVVLQAARPGPTAPGSEEEALAADRKIVQDFAQRRIFDRLLVYERRIEHSLYRTMAELRNLRRLREQDAAEAGTTAVSSVPVRAYLPSREETPDSVTTNVSEAESQPCETKPISEEVSSVKCQVLSSESALQTSPLKLDTAAEPPDQSC